MSTSTLSPRKLQSVAKLYRCGFTRCDISRITGIAVSFVPKCDPKAIKVPNYVGNYKGKRKPSYRINVTEVNAMITMRNRGDTLQSIAVALNRSVDAVFRHTRHIVNDRRHDRNDVINRKTGRVVRCCR